MREAKQRIARLWAFCGTPTQTPLLNRACDDGPLKAFIDPLQQFSGDLCNVIACHELLRRKLEEGNQQRIPNSFPLLLLDMAPSLHQAYVSYVVNFSGHCDVLRTIENAAGEQWWQCGCVALAQNIKEGDAELRDVDTSFFSLLAMPLQRLVRYTMLTNEWVEAVAQQNTQNESCDGSARQKALEAQKTIFRLCSEVNKSKELMSNSRKLMEIEKTYHIDGLSEWAGRRLIHEGTLTRATKKPTSWKLRSAHAFLFNDVFIVQVTRSTNRKYTVRIPLPEIMSVRSLPNCAHIKEGVNGIQITGKKGEELIFVDEDELNLRIWVKEISLAVDKTTTQE